MKVSTSGEPTVWVAKKDGSKQCEKNPHALTPEVASQELKSLGVMVYQSRKGHDGMMHITLCGADTGNTVELEIAQVDLPKAESQGYRALKKQN